MYKTTLLGTSNIWFLSIQKIRGRLELIGKGSENGTRLDEGHKSGVKPLLEGGNEFCGGHAVYPQTEPRGVGVQTKQQHARRSNAQRLQTRHQMCHFR